MKKVFFFLYVFFLLISCQQNSSNVELTAVDSNFQFESFDDDLFSDSLKFDDKLTFLEKKYPDFLPIFTYEMIQIGGAESDDYKELMESFISDTLILNVKKKADGIISKDQLKNDLEQAFKYYQHYFPEMVIPKIYTCISGFNQSIVMADSLVGISLDKYLGADCEYYPQLGIANYKTKNMHPQKIVPDVIYAWALTEFPIDESASHLLDHMVYQGKLLYLMDKVLPEMSDTLKMGYSKDQMDFCYQKEEAMWTYLAEYNLLFSTERMDVKRYVDAAPYTSSFTVDSPGRTGAWLGWQIVRAYMEKNKDVSLRQLMLDNDYQQILNNSGYQPGN